MVVLFTVTARHLDHTTMSVLLVGTSRLVRQAVLVEEDVALNSFRFPLRALVLVFFRPKPDTFNFDAADPGPPPCWQPLSSLRAIISPSPSYHTSRFHHLFSPQPLPSLSQGDALTLTASSNTD